MMGETETARDHIYSHAQHYVLFPAENRLFTLSERSRNGELWEITGPERCQ